MNIAAVIPTLYERPELESLTKQLAQEDIPTLVVCRPDEHNIHKMWNDAVRTVKGWGVDYVAILNDDIKLPNGCLKAMQQAMETNNLACVGVDPKARFGLPPSLRVKEVSGNVSALMTDITTWCFMVRLKDWQEIDERYIWWWGVGDLFTKISKAGEKLGQIQSLGIIHIGSGTAQNKRWVKEAIKQDAKTWRELH